MKTSCRYNPNTHIPFYLSVMFIFLILTGTSGSVHGQWKQHVIEESAFRVSDGCAYDIDSDGDMDLFTSYEYADMIVYYENISNTTWLKHIVDEGAGAPIELEVIDLNQDGNMDLLIAFFEANLIAWYEHEKVGEDSLHWTKREIDNSFSGAFHARASDINGDGATDVVSLYYKSGELVWYENNLPEAWTTHIIQTDITGYSSVDVGDMNNDNRPDIVCSYEKGNRVALFMNNMPDANWLEITVDENMPKTRWSEIGDIDNDGDMDIASGAQGTMLDEVDVAWYENDGTGENWIKHPIASEFRDGIYIAVADIDGNEYPDIVLSNEGNGTSGLYVLLNEVGGQHWTRLTVGDESEDFKHGQRVFDIDMDGDFDIIRGNVDGGDLSWYENPFPSAFASFFSVSPFLFQSTGDTLQINATMYDPGNHSALAWAVIRGDQTGFTDTLQLFDDGLHGDGSPMDHQYGNTRLKSDFQEDEFVVDLFTYDSTYEDTLGFFTDAAFITVGPLALRGWESTNDPIPYPGDLLRVEIELENQGSSAIATQITSRLTSLDSMATVPDYLRGFEDMAPGATSRSSNIFGIKISEDCPFETELPVEVTIFSHGHACWKDTFYILVTDTANNTNNLTIKATGVRIFPNPVNDLLTIETSQHGHLLVRITSVNSQLIHTSSLDGTSHQIDLSSFPKGVYFITIRSKDFVTTRKIVKL